MKSFIVSKFFLSSILVLSVLFIPMVINKAIKDRDSLIYLSDSEYEEFICISSKIPEISTYNEIQSQNAKDFLAKINKDGKISVYECDELKRCLSRKFAF